MNALLVLAVAGALHAHIVDVTILESRRLERLRADTTEIVAQEDGGVLVNGIHQGSFEGALRRWSVEARSIRRSYDGALSITSDHRRLKVVLHAPLESYVAGVVAAESDPATPPAALQALAVVVRSYAVATRTTPLCDLATCQVFHGVVRGRQGDEARDAAAATAGLALRLADGTVAGAPFHASCGGHTADPREVFGGKEKTGARAVSDLDADAPWTARVGETGWRRATREAFGDPFLADEPLLVRGAGDRIVQLALPDGRRASGDALVRALDRAQGRGVVRSARFTLRREGDEAVLTGTGHGHGVGLCQAGAALRALRGDAFEAILKAYFPVATLAPASSTSGLRTPGAKHPGFGHRGVCPHGRCRGPAGSTGPVQAARPTAPASTKEEISKSVPSTTKNAMNGSPSR